MKKWNKRQISGETVASLNVKYGIDYLTASILTRRGVIEGNDIQFYMEDNERYLHNPFLFKNMEDVVDRILQAKDEEEKVMIFGDKDVDGITSTTVLYDYLSSIGIDVRYRLPCGTDAYGLNLKSIDEFEKDYGSLIITVDCGISNVKEIAYAAEKGMDVIVLDHHNPPEFLPEPAIIIDAKCEDSGYPFKDISGCAVAYKVVSALRFAMSDLYKNEVALLSIHTENIEGKTKYFVDVLKTQNLVEKHFISEEVEPGTLISHTKLVNFLSGQQIFVWDEKKTKNELLNLFGAGSDFNVFDFRTEAAKIWPGMAKSSLADLRKKSKIAIYNQNFDSEIKTFFNLFVTYTNYVVSKRFPGNADANEKDLQLVALAALADIMPLVNENRILVRKGIESINKGKARSGLLELLSIQNLLQKTITSTDLSWCINPALNATGRLGSPDIGINLLIEKDVLKRQELAQKVIEMNNTRKQYALEAENYVFPKAQESITKHNDKLCLIFDERIHRGVLGSLAAKLVQAYSVPTMVITIVGDVAIGSMRSCRGFDITSFLDELDKAGKNGNEGLFISHGGHNYAAGFSFDKTRFDEFNQILSSKLSLINLSNDETEIVDIDAEIPEEYIKPELLSIVDRFEPYGEANKDLIFMSKRLKIESFAIMGKDSQHLKLLLRCDSSTWPAIYWNHAECIHKDFDIGSFVDIIYKIERNTYNGNVTPQMNIVDIELSK